MIEKLSYILPTLAQDHYEKYRRYPEYKNDLKDGEHHNDFRHQLFQEGEILQMWYIMMQIGMFGIIALLSLCITLKHRKILTCSSILLMLFLNLQLLVQALGDVYYSRQMDDLLAKDENPKWQDQIPIWLEASWVQQSFDKLVIIVYDIMVIKTYKVYAVYLATSQDQLSRTVRKADCILYCYLIIQVIFGALKVSFVILYYHSNKNFTQYTELPQVEEMLHDPHVITITITSTLLYIIELIMIYYFIKTSTYIFTTYLRQERVDKYKGIPPWKYVLMGAMSSILPILYFIFVTQHELFRYGNFFFEYAFLQINERVKSPDDTKELEKILQDLELFLALTGPSTCFVISITILFVINFFAKAVKNKRKELFKKYKNELYNVNNRREDMLNQIRQITDLTLKEDNLDEDSSLTLKYGDNKDKNRFKNQVHLAVNYSNASLESQDLPKEQKEFLKDHLNQILEEENESSNEGSSRLSNLLDYMDSRIGVNSARTTLLDVIEQQMFKSDKSNTGSMKFQNENNSHLGITTQLPKRQISNLDPESNNLDGYVLKQHNRSSINFEQNTDIIMEYFSKPENQIGRNSSSMSGLHQSKSFWKKMKSNF